MVQLTKLVASLVAAGVMPIFVLIHIFSAGQLSAFSKFPYFGHLNHLTMESLGHLEELTTTKTVKLMFEASAVQYPLETQVCTPGLFDTPKCNHQLLCILRSNIREWDRQVSKLLIAAKSTGKHQHEVCRFGDL